MAIFLSGTGGTGMVQGGAQLGSYAGASSAVVTPREIGYLDRLHGLCVGLDTLESRLIDFSQRLEGAPPASDKVSNAAVRPEPPASMADRLSYVEGTLRRIMETVSHLHDRF